MPAVQGQPDLPGIWDFEVANVLAQEVGGLAPGHIINAGNNFSLVTSLTNDGFLGVVLVGATGTIQYRAERLEDNVVVALPSTAFTMPAGVNVTVTSAAFTSGPAPADLDVGTYMVTAIVSMNPPFNTAVAGFIQTVIRVI